VSVSPIPACLVDVDQAGSTRNSQDEVRRSAWVSKDPIFSRQSWQLTHINIRPQGRKHIKKIQGRKVASARALEICLVKTNTKILGYGKANTFIYMCAWYN
jgi:hypothetical protein